MGQGLSSGTALKHVLNAAAMQVRAKKDYTFKQSDGRRRDGRLCNVAEGLELHHELLNKEEQSILVQHVHSWVDMGRRVSQHCLVIICKLSTSSWRCCSIVFVHADLACRTRSELAEAWQQRSGYWCYINAGCRPSAAASLLTCWPSILLLSHYQARASAPCKKFVALFLACLNWPC